VPHILVFPDLRELEHRRHDVARRLGIRSAPSSHEAKVTRDPTILGGRKVLRTAEPCYTFFNGSFSTRISSGEAQPIATVFSPCSLGQSQITSHVTYGLHDVGDH